MPSGAGVGRGAVCSLVSSEVAGSKWAAVLRRAGICRIIASTQAALGRVVRDGTHGSQVIWATRSPEPRRGFAGQQVQRDGSSIENRHAALFKPASDFAR
jgi:hypothetical protein